VAKTKKYKANSFNTGVLPYIISDLIGLDNFNKLQIGETVSLPSNLPYDILQYLDEVEEVDTKVKTKTTKDEEKS
tara:strand:- start:4307 stop:4531 length:225 start_codon:yes stop_codon:yes gene_type:complete